MFCHRSLKTNEVVEAFPVGRRLAFDAAKGRLWVVCRYCERWNLTPLEERWEAVEACEEIFRGTRLRKSSENIGLARLPEGLELVRIGKPLRPEFAAWRYGDQFGRRRRRYLLYGVSAAVLGGGTYAAGLAVGLAASTALHVVNLMNIANVFRPRVWFRPSDGRPRWLNRRNLYATRIIPDEDDPGFRVGWRSLRGRPQWFEGDDARCAIDAVLPRLNSSGGSKRTVQDAVKEIESHRHPSVFLEQVAKRGENHRHRGVPGYLSKFPSQITLALEMALHEEEERRALESELWKLERAWRDAEEIAGIADSLLLPKGADDFVARHSPDGAEHEP